VLQRQYKKLILAAHVIPSPGVSAPDIDTEIEDDDG